MVNLYLTFFFPLLLLAAANALASFVCWTLGAYMKIACNQLKGIDEIAHGDNLKRLAAARYTHQEQ